MISSKEFEGRTSPDQQPRQLSKSLYCAYPLNLPTASYEEEFPPISPTSKTPSPTKWGKRSETPKSPEIYSHKDFPKYTELTHKVTEQEIAAFIGSLGQSKKS